MSQPAAAQDDKRTVFYARDIHRLNLVLGRFLQKSGAETIILVDDAGHLVARQGNMDDVNVETVAALVAGTYAASRAMAEMLGSAEYSCQIPCAAGRHVLLLPAGARWLLGVTVTEDTSITLVRTYALEAVRRIGEIIKSGRSSGDPDERIEGKKFDSELDGALTDVFG